MHLIKPNTLLIAEPFLQDTFFTRSVVYLCKHDDEGSVGFRVNQKCEATLNELIAGLEGFPIPVYIGGPVETDTIHFLHQCPESIPGGQAITEDIFWGGDFEVVSSLIVAQQLDYSKIKFFLGCSGWSKGQLEAEYREKTWLLTDAVPGLIFRTEAEGIWKESIRQLGKEFEPMMHYPIDPQLN